LTGLRRIEACRSEDPNEGDEDTSAERRWEIDVKMSWMQASESIHTVDIWFMLGWRSIDQPEAWGERIGKGERKDEDALSFEHLRRDVVEFVRAVRVNVSTYYQTSPPKATSESTISD